MSRLLAIMLLALLPLLPAHAQATAPGNVLVARGRTEPVVAVDPRHGSTVLVASNTNYAERINGGFPPGHFTSHNGGRSFGFGATPLRYPYSTGADPSLAIGDNGIIYHSYLGETPSYCSGGRSAVVLTTSSDGGASFRVPSIVDDNPADDKPYLALENTPHGRTHLLVTWTRWHRHGSDIWYARSLDGGQSFSRPVMLFSSALDNFGSLPVVGPHGHVYVFWSNYPERASSATSPTRIYLRASADDGAHFQPARVAAGTFWSIPSMAAPGSLRILTAPTAGAAKNGTVFLAWAAAVRQHRDGSVDANIMLSRSRDAGRTWSRPVRVNDVTRLDRFMPSLSVLADGSLGIAFYDRRNNPWSLDLYAVHVSFRHGVHVSRNVRVNRLDSPISDIYYIAPGSTCFSPGRFFGDYIGTAALPGGGFCAVWADTQLHVYNETDLWFARITLPAVGPPSRLSGTERAGRTEHRGTFDYEERADVDAE